MVEVARRDVEPPRGEAVFEPDGLSLDGRDLGVGRRNEQGAGEKPGEREGADGHDRHARFH
ncbi:hypothetical protein D3C72_2548420 [compost metagenome]